MGKGGDHSKKTKKRPNKKAEKKITKEKAKRHEMIRVSTALPYLDDREADVVIAILGKMARKMGEIPRVIRVNTQRSIPWDIPNVATAKLQKNIY